MKYRGFQIHKTAAGKHYVIRAGAVLKSCKSAAEARRHIDTLVCKTCKHVMNDPADPGTLDCGGDCRRCMAEAGDPDCMRTMAGLPW